MPIRSGGKAPYAPPTAILDIINGFRDRGLAVPFTQEVLLRAGINESLVPRTLKSLEDLDLIDKAGNPTDALEGLRRASTDEFQARLEEVARAAYSEVFQFADVETDDRGRVEDAFRAYNPPGQRGRMVTLFIGLCQAAGIIPEDSKLTKAKVSTPSSAKPRARASGAKAATRRKATTAGSIPPALAGLLDALPANGEGWTPEEREKFYETFGTVLDFSIPIRKDERPQADSSDEEA